MTRLIRITATGLAVASVVPAAVLGASKLDLQGAPTLRLIGDDRAKVTFAVDDAIAGNQKGAAQLEGDERAAIRPDGRHGDDYRYRAIFDDTKGLEAGKRYEIRVEARGYAPKTLKLKLIDKR